MSAQENTQVAQATEAGFKVFCGNLSFATQDAELSQVFGAIGEISNAQIINRGARSLGYGFITFVNESDALKAVASLDKSEIDGRQVNVEMAKPAAAPKERVQRVAAVPQEVVDENGDVVTRPKKSNRNRSKATRGGRRPRSDDQTEEAGDALPEALANVRISDAPAGETNGDAAPRRRAPRAPRPAGSVAPVRRVGPPTGEPSKTLVFVANLPFSVDDAGLKTVFEGYEIVSTRVVVKKFGPGEGRSKGFGFVDFASEAEQTRALANAFAVDGREIALKVAIAEAVVEGEPEAPVVVAA